MLNHLVLSRVKAVKVLGTVSAIFAVLRLALPGSCEQIASPTNLTDSPLDGSVMRNVEERWSALIQQNNFDEAETLCRDQVRSGRREPEDVLRLYKLLEQTYLAKIGAKKILTPEQLALHGCSMVLSEATCFDGPWTGLGASKSHVYRAYEECFAISTQIKEELCWLIGHAKPAGRLYAALLLRHIDRQLGTKALES